MDSTMAAGHQWKTLILSVQSQAIGTAGRVPLRCLAQENLKFCPGKEAITVGIQTLECTLEQIAID